MDFILILGGLGASCLPNNPQQIHQKSIKKPIQLMIAQIVEEKGHATNLSTPRPRVWGPLNYFNQTFQEAEIVHSNTPTRARGTVAACTDT